VAQGDEWEQLNWSVGHRPSRALVAWVEWHLSLPSNDLNYVMACGSVEQDQAIEKGAEGVTESGGLRCGRFDLAKQTLGLYTGRFEW
jgi:hypothetical protein